MGLIKKGRIASISGDTARVVPVDSSSLATAKITIPWHLRGSGGNLKKGTVVVYAEFADSTGLLIGRADGIGEGGGGSGNGNGISDIKIIEVESNADNDGGNESNNEGVST